MIKTKKEKKVSKSQKLRAVLYLQWMDSPLDSGLNQEEYYEQEMDRIIQEESSKLK